MTAAPPLVAARGARPPVRRVLRDLLDDVVVEMDARRSRALLMVLAVGLSTGALQASAGISAQASQQIGADIAASALDLVSVSVVPPPDSVTSDPLPSGGAPVLPDDTERRLAAVDLVAVAGRRLDVDRVVSPKVSRWSDGTSTREGGERPAVVGLTSGYLRAAGTGAPEQLLFLLDGEAPVALLGPLAAEQLGVPVTDDPTGLQIRIDGRPHDVVGFVAGGGPAALDNAVVVPYARGVRMAGGDNAASVLIRAVPGAGAQVARAATVAVRPDAPERLAASQVASVSSLRRGVSTQLDRLAAWTGAVLMTLTVLLIANSMVVSVLARTSEIGLRRALGSSRAVVAALFLSEGAVVGALGGLGGSALAAVTVVLTAVANGWTSVLQLSSVALGPLLGLAVGLVASAYPALRAARISPALAVRAD